MRSLILTAILAAFSVQAEPVKQAPANDNSITVTKAKESCKAAGKEGKDLLNCIKEALDKKPEAKK